MTLPIIVVLCIFFKLIDILCGVMIYFNTPVRTFVVVIASYVYLHGQPVNNTTNSRVRIPSIAKFCFNFFVSERFGEFVVYCGYCEYFHELD